MTTVLLLILNLFFAAWNVHAGEAFWAAMNAFAAGGLAAVFVLELKEGRP